MEELSTFYALCARSGPFRRHVVITTADYVRRAGRRSTPQDRTIAFGTLRNITSFRWMAMLRTTEEEQERPPAPPPAAAFEEPSREELSSSPQSLPSSAKYGSTSISTVIASSPKMVVLSSRMKFVTFVIVLASLSSLLLPVANM